MVNVQVLLDGRGASDEDIFSSVSTLRRGVKVVELTNTSVAAQERLRDAFGRSVVLAQTLRRDVPVVVVSGRIAFAAGALRRLVNRTMVDGRYVTRVFVPALAEPQQVTCWSPTWLRTYEGDVADVIDAGLSFDRAFLPEGSSVARLWVRAEEVGVAPVAQVEGALVLWAIRSGVDLDARHSWAVLIRRPMGVVRRRLGRRRQRRRHQA